MFLFWEGFLTALLISIGSSALGVFVVIRRLSTIGAGISHLSFASVAIALSLNLEPTIFSLIIALVSALILRGLSLRQGIPADASTAVLFALGPAIANLLLAKGDFSPIELNSILYGSLLQAQLTDVFISAFICFASLIFILLFFRALILLSLSEELAKLKGVKVKAVEYTLSALTGISVAISIKAVGILLSSSLIVIPSLAAILMSNSLKRAVLNAIFIAMLSVSLGMFLSIKLDIPPSSAIVGLCVLALFFAISLKRL
ncbi:MAG: metal ABC transporter permease [Aquificaceae bacterium]|nr:metal ABC transporter permease [Aquificaceae bacterium]MDW8237620.1 metal ABC transporter permease [Aquificaceae bacterium]